MKYRNTEILKYRNLSRKRGQALITAVVFFFGVSLTIVIGALSPVFRQIHIATDFQNSKQSYYTAESGSEDGYYRLKNSLTTSFPETLAIGGATSTIALSTIDSTNKEIVSTGSYNNLIRVVLKDITLNNGFLFQYGVQSGVGGITMNNNSVILGNVYSNGTVQSSSNGANNWNTITGSVVSADASGYVYQIYSTSSVYAHTISNVKASADIYYSSSITSGIASGSNCPNSHCHSGSTDQPTVAMPVTDALISQWETDAANGGSVTCTAGSYTISSGPVTIGPKKIPCNLIISGNGTTVYFSGALWVTGTISFSGSGSSGVQIYVADSVGNKSVPVVADLSTSRLTGSTISLTGNSNFYGSTGNSTSNVLLVSENNSAENSGSVVAIDAAGGSAGSVLVYAPHGQVSLSNGVQLKEVTAYKMTINNNSEVIYSTDLSNPLFVSGSSGAWKIRKWRESQ